MTSIWVVPCGPSDGIVETCGMTALELSPDEYRELQAHARGVGITFFATAFDVESADFLAELDMPAFKFASGDIRNTPLLRHVAAFGKPMVLSTGRSTSSSPFCNARPRTRPTRTT